MSESSGNRRVAIVGEDEPGFVDALRHALSTLGVHSLVLSASKLRVAARAPDMTLILGDAAEDGGVRVMEQIGVERGPFAVVLGAGQLAVRLEARQRGVTIVPRGDDGAAVAKEVQRVLAGYWGSGPASPPSKRVPRAKPTPRPSPVAPPAVAVDGLDWDDEPETTQSSPPPSGIAPLGGLRESTSGLGRPRTSRPAGTRTTLPGGLSRFAPTDGPAAANDATGGFDGDESTSRDLRPDAVGGDPMDASREPASDVETLDAPVGYEKLLDADTTAPHTPIGIREASALTSSTPAPVPEAAAPPAPAPLPSRPEPAVTVPAPAMPASSAVAPPRVPPPPALRMPPPLPRTPGSSQSEQRAMRAPLGRAKGAAPAGPTLRPPADAANLAETMRPAAAEAPDSVAPPPRRDAPVGLDDAWNMFGGARSSEAPRAARASGAPRAKSPSHRGFPAPSATDESTRETWGPPPGEEDDRRPVDGAAADAERVRAWARPTAPEPTDDAREMEGRDGAELRPAPRVDVAAAELAPGAGTPPEPRGGDDAPPGVSPPEPGPPSTGGWSPSPAPMATPLGGDPAPPAVLGSAPLVAPPRDVPAAVPVPIAAAPARRSGGGLFLVVSLLLGGLILAGALAIGAWLVLRPGEIAVDPIAGVGDTADPSEVFPPSVPVPPADPIAPRDPIAPSDPIAPGDVSDPNEPTAHGAEGAPPATEPVAELEVVAPTEPAPAEAPLDPEVARERSDELVREARAHERARRFDEARAGFEQAAAVYDLNPHAHAGLARVAMAVQDSDAAVRFAERAAELRRLRPEYHVLVGDARAAAGDAPGARRAYQRALELDPDDADARARLGGRGAAGSRAAPRDPAPPQGAEPTPSDPPPSVAPASDDAPSDDAPRDDAPMP